MPNYIRILSLVLLLAFPLAAFAAEGDREWSAAGRLFEDTFFNQSENAYRDFVKLFPSSERRAEAVLMEARSRYRLAERHLSKGEREESVRSFAMVVELLKSQMPQAGEFAGEYLFWIGLTEFESGNYSQSADAYNRLLAHHPNFSKRLEASVNEAMAWARMQNYSKTANLLQDSDSPFTTATRQQPNHEGVAKGNLILAEALLNLKRLKEAENILILWERRAMDPENSWLRQYLMCKVLLGMKRPEEALKSIPSLHEAAVAGGKKQFRSESKLLEAEILEFSGQANRAIQVYEDLASTYPESKRYAALKVVDLLQKQNQFEQADERMKLFLQGSPEEKDSELGRLVIGELSLRRFYVTAGLNLPVLGADPAKVDLKHAKEALDDFDYVLNQPTYTNYLGRVHLGRGWVFWGLNKMSECQSAFQKAAKLLPEGELQAVARFKLGDTQFVLQDYVNAATTYAQLLQDYSSNATVRNGLYDQILYQSLRASILNQDEEGTTKALSQLLDLYPDGYYSPKSFLLAGQYLNRVGKTVDARELFKQALKLAPQLKPLVDLAVTRTLVIEMKWKEALAMYDQWLAENADHELRPEVSFNRARVLSSSGNDLAAYEVYTEFYTKYPANELAPMAATYAADFDYLLGTSGGKGNESKLLQAEKTYQMIASNWRGSELAWRAELQAGKSAAARSSHAQASTYFVAIIENKNCPTNIVAEACLAYGDLQVADGAAYAEAINSFRKITKLVPGTDLSAAALKRMGDCHYQLASGAPGDRYVQALDSYSQAAGADYAVLDTRASATLGIANVRVRLWQAATEPKKKQEELDNALERFAEVFYEKIPGVIGSSLDPYLRKEAAIGFLNLLEQINRWDQVVTLCERIQVELPILKDFAEAKKAVAKKNLEGK